MRYDLLTFFGLIIHKKILLFREFVCVSQVDFGSLFYEIKENKIYIIEKSEKKYCNFLLKQKKFL